MKDKIKSVHKRTISLAIFIVLLFLLILGKATYLKTIKGAEYAERINKTMRSNKPIPAVRGEILAKDGRTLACSVPNYKLVMDPCAPSDEVFNSNINELGQCLATLYKDNTAEFYANKIKSRRSQGKRYLVINSKKIGYNELKKAREFPIFKLGKNKGGFIPEESDYRKMPFGTLASRTIGRITGEMAGLEQTYNKILKGRDGVCNSIRITNKWIDREITPPEDGKSLLTTIDVDIQDVAENSLMNQLQRHNADHGVAILMEVKTGAVRAIVNLHKQGDSYVEDRNYAVSELKDPGSTFKLATIMACLEDGVIKDVDKDTINIFDGEYRIYDRIMRDSHKEPNPIVSIAKAFEISSNIAFSRLALKHYGNDPQRFIDRLRDLGICDSLGIDIKGESATYLKNVSDKTWSGISLPWISIGYEVLITPLHLLSLYNAVANDGTMMRPMFVEGIVEHGEVVERMRPKVLRNSIASRRTIETVKKLLEGVVKNGTARNISNTNGYAIAGKTGTAQVAFQGKGYSQNGEKKYLASFAGYFPTDEPMYSCIVMVYGPSNNVYYGNIVAGSVVKDIADRVYASACRAGSIDRHQNIAQSQVYPYSKGGRQKDIQRVLSELGIKRSSDAGTKWVSTIAQENGVKISPRPSVDGYMPDVRGMGASDAVSLLEERGLKVVLNGYGRVRSQSIPHGTSYIKGSTVVIELSNS